MERGSRYVIDPSLSDYDFIKNPETKAIGCLRLYDSKVRPELNMIIGTYLMMHMDLYHDPEEKGIDESTRRKRQLILDMRGIIFDAKSGRCLRRPWEKFFNLGETLAKVTSIDWNDALAVEKLDGSMLCPVVVADDDVVWMTKKSFNADVDAFVELNPIYNKMVTSFPEWSCMFEWCSPKNRVVVGYDESRLILTGMRNIRFGTYKPFSELQEISKKHGVPCANMFPLQPENEWKSYLPKIYALEKLEGCVLVSKTTGRPLCKLKCNWYVNIHKACSDIRESTAIPWQCVLNETLDDVLPRLSDELVDQMQRFNSAVFEGIARKSEQVLSFVNEKWDEAGKDEKEFSKIILMKEVDKELRPLYFLVKRGLVSTANYDAFETVLMFLKKNMKSIPFLESFTGVSLSTFRK